MSPPNIEIPKGAVMTPLPSQENALVAFTKTPPRKLTLDPKSARTVVHEIRAHHRGSAGRDSSPAELFPPPPPQFHVNGKEASGKFGIMPDRNRYVPPRRSKSRHRRRNYDTDSDADSESEDYLKSRHLPHRQRSNSDQSRSSHNSRVSNRPSNDHRQSNELITYNHRRDLALVPKPRSRSSHSDSESDSGYDSVTTQERKKRAARNKKILYTGLATITTVSAANSIYQNTKGFHGRRNAFKEAAENGELLDDEERRKRRNKHLMMDAFGMLVVGIAANNVRIGWQRREEKRRAHEATEQKAAERFERRERGPGRSKAYSVEEF